ncbi:hypothetical protein AQUCO_00900642v1 [Aquilegia coerulea]|uniref:Uncharacterized protein n=1 Tax=Aquilegia coerulea TaxID=218851 RepID=A0A2G5EEQ4_AQUCA|nr:hypothetical protein AQUCO_00900642v1 [Aquilegia coerulea]
MYNAMMDPELMRIAQEQMSKIPPSELAKMQQQMMSNPELIRMASERMKNMRPEDFKTAAEQMKHARVEDMTEMSKKIANASPEEIASMTAQADAQVSYVLNAAQMLKKQGNDLHNQGKFREAAQKYLRAKNNLKDIPVSKGRALQMACSLNLMSCYLKTRQYDECIKEGSEVLEYDTENIKALYRRGQAYKESGLLEDAVSDLSRAHSVAPDDETIVDTLRETKDRLSKEDGERGTSRRLVIEEITEEVQTLPPESHKSSSSADYSVTEPHEVSDSSESQTGSSVGGPTTDADCLRGLEINPDTLRSFQNLVSNADPETLAALSGGSTEGMPPEMIKTASNMIKNMPPEELQNMLKMASSFQGKNPFFPAGAGQANGSNVRPGSLPEGVSPDMLKTASDMMSKMSPEELQKMFEVASNFKSKESVNGARTMNGSVGSNSGETRLGESSSSSGLFSNSRSDPPAPANFPASMGDLKEQMQNQMNDPAMRQMFTSMIKNMSPDMMANMSEQFGIKMSKEEAAKAQQAMSSLSPDALDSMMRWADRIQRGVEVAKKTKSYLFGRSGMIFAICMLILAIILHRLGFVGS